MVRASRGANVTTWLTRGNYPQIEVPALNIHPTAIVSPQAVVGRNVTIGPHSVVESDVFIGDGCRLASRTVVRSGTKMGVNNVVSEGVVLGGEPQVLPPPTKLGQLVIGDENRIRENVTVHRAMDPAKATVIGDQNILMVNSHVAHDCIIGNNVILVNNTMIAGHVEVQDKAYVAGGAGVQQFCRVGRLATVGGQARLTKDLPPFVTMDGVTCTVVGLNLVGLRRAGYDRHDIRQLKEAYRIIYRSGLTWKEVLEQLPNVFNEGPATEFYEFFAKGERGFVPERRAPAQATVPLPPTSAEENPELHLHAG